jgi:uncharacterized protein
MSQWLLAWALLLFSNASFAEFKVPPLAGPVMDLAGVLDPSDKRWLEESFTQLQSKGVAQLQILTVTSLDGASIEQAALQVAETWKLGSEKKDNGLLIFFSLGDRQVRIEVGQGLEGLVPDILAGRIVRNIMIPQFKNKNYSSGLVDGSSHLIDLVSGNIRPDELAGENLPVAGRSTEKGNSLHIFIFIFLFLIIQVFSRIGPRRRRGFWGSSSGWGSGGGFGGGGFGGGGGGWSGGGGGFSGGGSSGRW